MRRKAFRLSFLVAALAAIYFVPAPATACDFNACNQACENIYQSCLTSCSQNCAAYPGDPYYCGSVCQDDCYHGEVQCWSCCSFFCVTCL
jgi:hypothetical protein